ncbi:MAG: ABC transporter ATP-binding protein/permease [Armatimonadota bacterium]|nr:ABC transporter ATP-binding protein/permease [Armatimonadota bacterium]
MLGGGGEGGGGGWYGGSRSLGGMSRGFGLGRMNYSGVKPSPTRFARQQLKRVAKYLTPYWQQWLVIFVCIAATAALGVLPPLCVRGILDQAIPHQDFRLLNWLVGAIVGLNILVGLVGVLQNYLNVRVGQSIIHDLRHDLFRHLQQMSLPFYTSMRAGEIVSRVSNDVAAVQNTATATLISIVTNLLTVIATLIVIFTMDWRLALLAVIGVPTLILPTRIVGKVRHSLSQQTQERQADLLVFLQERLNIGGTLLTKIFGQGRADAATFSRHNRAVMELNIRQALVGRWLFMFLSVFSIAGPALIYWYGGYLAIQRQLSVGTIIAFVAYLTNLYRPLAQLANVYVDVQGALAVFERIFEFLDLQPEVEDKPNAQVLTAVQGHIRFEGVSFAYPPTAAAGTSAPAKEEQGEARSTPFTLHDVTFEMLPGQRVALVGPSGAGKTTITYLLPRFHDPTSGRITIDGHDLREVTQESLRAHIGMVTQETFLFHASVRENLLYARPDATEQQMIAAAQAAHIHEVIQNLPEGYDTLVGERAFRLSGGERQRLAIARALLKDPCILILDEATSSLDATSEYLIQQALETLLRGRTSLIIAHRLSTILSADKILVLDRGRLVEAGRHDELLAHGGLYATLYHQQLSRVVKQSMANGDARRLQRKDEGVLPSDEPLLVAETGTAFTDQDEI